MHLKLDHEPIKIELDTGAAISVMSEQQWKTLFTEDKPLRPYEGNHYRVFRIQGASDWTNKSRCGIWKPKEGTSIVHSDWRVKTPTVRMQLASQY